MSVWHKRKFEFLRGLTAVWAAFVILTTAAQAQTLEYYKNADGSIRLWTAGAPELVARQSGGWSLTPEADSKKSAWRKALKALEASSWGVVLDELAGNHQVSGTQEVKSLGTIYFRLRPELNDVRVTASNRPDSTISVTFPKRTDGYKPADTKLLEAWLAQQARVQPSAVRKALPESVGDKNDPWTTLVAKEAGDDPLDLLYLSGTGGAFQLKPIKEAEYAALSAPPKPTTNKKSAPKESGSGLWILAITAPVCVVGGLALALVPAVRKRLPQVGKAATRNARLAPQDDEDVVLSEALRREHLEQQNVGQTDCDDPRAWLREIVQKNLALQSRVFQLREQCQQLEHTHDETARLSAEYRNQHHEWVRDRDATMAKLNALNKDLSTSQARQSELATLVERERAANNAERDSMRQHIEALTRDTQSYQRSTQDLVRRAKAYSELQSQSDEAFRLVQAEIGRIDVAAVVGYMLTYSIAHLMETLLVPNPEFEAAMLSNIEVIASNVSGMAQCIRLANSARTLREAAGVPELGPSPELSPDARHISGLLRFLRDQKRLQFSPFYTGVDAQHRAYVVSL